MGRTFVAGTITGPSETRKYRFFVDTGSALMSLSMEKIEALGLERTRRTTKFIRGI